MLFRSVLLVGTPLGTVSQTRNVDCEYYGAEASVTARVTPKLTPGGNYTWLHRDFTDPTNAAFRPQGVPTRKLLAYADWQVAERLTLTPSVETASKRWTVTSISLITPVRYYRTGPMCWPR